VVAHRSSTLAYCSRLLRLEGGRLVHDGPLPPDTNRVY
jgi:ABC-type bacteriocin/lantibiotic exporter with double-glycine peptidase domain